MINKIVFTLGYPVDGFYPMEFTVVLKKNWYNRFRYWMFFRFFPFDFKEWINEE